jgi:hypothetical protein
MKSPRNDSAEGVNACFRLRTLILIECWAYPPEKPLGPMLWGLLSPQAQALNAI